MSNLLIKLNFVKPTLINSSRTSYQNNFVFKRDRDVKVKSSDVVDLRETVQDVPIVKSVYNMYQSRVGKKIEIQPDNHTRNQDALFRRDYLHRGPTTPYLNQLKKGQLGVMTTKPCMFSGIHMEKIREHLKAITYVRSNINCMWNIQMPWKARTKLENAAVMGGGKGQIAFYQTPIKARQIVCEVYGVNMNYNEIFPYISDIVNCAPGQMVIVTPSILQSLLREEYLIEELNQNHLSFREVMVKNLGGGQKQVNVYDKKYFGKYL